MHPDVAVDVLAIPLWINGRAFLTVTPAFGDVVSPSTGKTLRRVPLCGPDELQLAIDSAQSVGAPWAVLTPATRAAVLDALGEALAGYAAHFAGMISEETGKADEVAEAEVNAAVALLRGGRERSSPGVASVLGRADEPLLGALRVAVPALLAGATLIVCPPLEAPSALFALAELSARCGLPGGVLNIVYGGAALETCLRENGLRMLSS